MEVIPIIGILASMVAAVLIVWFVTHSRQRRVEIQAQVQSKLIDRFGSAPELVDFLQSPAGRAFVQGVQSAPVAQTRNRILSGFTRAIVLTSLGLAFVFLTFVHDADFTIPAAILFFLGLGYLIATIVSFKLTKMHLSDLQTTPTSGEQIVRS